MSDKKPYPLHVTSVTFHPPTKGLSDSLNDLINFPVKIGLSFNRDNHDNPENVFVYTYSPGNTGNVKFNTDFFIESSHNVKGRLWGLDRPESNGVERYYTLIPSSRPVADGDIHVRVFAMGPAAAFVLTIDNF